MLQIWPVAISIWKNLFFRQNYQFFAFQNNILLFKVLITIFLWKFALVSSILFSKEVMSANHLYIVSFRLLLVCFLIRESFLYV